MTAASTFDGLSNCKEAAGRHYSRFTNSSAAPLFFPLECSPPRQPGHTPSACEGFCFQGSFLPSNCFLELCNADLFYISVASSSLMFFAGAMLSQRGAAGVEGILLKEPCVACLSDFLPEYRSARNTSSLYRCGSVSARVSAPPTVSFTRMYHKLRRED